MTPLSGRSANRCALPLILTQARRSYDFLATLSGTADPRYLERGERESTMVNMIFWAQTATNAGLVST